MFNVYCYVFIGWWALFPMAAFEGVGPHLPGHWKATGNACGNHSNLEEPDKTP